MSATVTAAVRVLRQHAVPFTEHPEVAQMRVATFMCPSEENDRARETPTLTYYPLNYCFNEGTWFIYDPVSNEAGDGAQVFDRATAAAADLSAAGFGSMDGAAKMLGKALNDPEAGLTALGRAGVTFTDQQKEQIKTLVESGDTLGAQKIILGEVESQVGGTAAASATAGEKISVAFGNFFISVAKALCGNG